MSETKRATQVEGSARTDGALGFETSGRTPVAFDVRPAGALTVDGGGEDVASEPDAGSVPSPAPTAAQEVTKKTGATSKS